MISRSGSEDQCPLHRTECTEGREERRAPEPQSMNPGFWNASECKSPQEISGDEWRLAFPKGLDQMHTIKQRPFFPRVFPTSEVTHRAKADENRDVSRKATWVKPLHLEPLYKHSAGKQLSRSIQSARLTCPRNTRKTRKEKGSTHTNGTRRSVPFGERDYF